jgi:hypothetical protein
MDRRAFMSLALSAAAIGWRDIARAEEHRALSGASKPRTMPRVSYSDTRGPPPR